MQNKAIILVVFFIFQACHLATPLKCYDCNAPCVLESETVCRDGEVCVTKTGMYGASTTYKRGCTNNTMCNQVTKEDVMGTTIDFKNQCCNSDLCNSAHHLEVPAVAVLAAIVAAWISKLW